VAYRPEARAEVVAALVDLGGRIEDRKGFATTQLRRHVEQLFGARQASGFTDLITEMSRTMCVQRELAGRRTYVIALKDVDDELLSEAASLLLRVHLDEAEVSRRMTGAGFSEETSLVAIRTEAFQRRERADLYREVQELSQQLKLRIQDLADARREVEKLRQERTELREQVKVAESDLRTLEDDLQKLYGLLADHGIEVANG
jgi:hypothetical protein